MGETPVGRIALFFIQIFAFFFSILPRFIQGALGRGLGLLFYRLKFRLRIVKENLERAYPGQAHAGKRQILERQAYTHLGELILEIFLVLAPFGGMKRFVQKNVDMIGAEHLVKAVNSGQGAILLSSHVGNWEIMAASGHLPEESRAKFDLLLVTKRIKPAWLFDAIERGRARYQVHGTYEPRTLKDVFAQFKKGGVVGIVLDQYAGPPVGIRVPVFGTPVGTHSLVAMLAKRTGAAVLPVVNYRLPGGRVRVEIGAPIGWISDSDPQNEIGINTANYASILEKHIHSHPDQWLWIHRRFKGDLSALRPGEWTEGRARGRT